MKRTGLLGLLLAMALALTAGAADLSWESDLSEAMRQARQTGKPILVRGDMAWCEWCRRFDQTLSDESVLPRLEKYIRVKLALDNASQAVADLGLRAAPAVALLAPGGARLALTEGYLPPAEFLAWLDAAEKKAATGLGLRRLTEPELARLLADPDAVLREAVAQELLSRTAEKIPKETAAILVEAFAEGALAQRLGALEVLRAWGAPAADADPWQPETLAPVLAALREWAKTPGAPAHAAPTAGQIEVDWAAWLSAPDGPNARAAFERLARCGAALLPRVREAMPPTWTPRRERLTALLYRLLMSAAVAQDAPEAAFQMAARDAAVRAQALDAVAKAARARAAGADMQAFFLEAFSDPDSKVREAALRGLRETGTALARANVLKLLNDPSPNIRAGVLNDLARSPLPALAADLAVYAAREQDEDLVVHAVRALRAVRSRPAAFRAIIAMVDHASWRVRAEAVDSLGDTSVSERRLDNLPDDQRDAMIAGLRKALADPDAFVASRAIEVVAGEYNMDMAACLPQLLGTMERHPDLILPAISAIGRNDALRKAAAAPMRRLCGHTNPEVRAAAIHTLVTATNLPARDEILGGLADDDTRVRRAAARAVHEWLSSVQYEMPAPSSGNQRNRLRTALALIPGAVRQEFLAGMRPMLHAKDVEERFAALLTTAVLGDTELALPGIEEVVAAEPRFVGETAGILPFLAWSEREELFEQLSMQPLDADDWSSLFHALFADAPADAESRLWAVFDGDARVLGAPSNVLSAILDFYEISGGLWSDYGQPPPAAVIARVETAARRLLAGAAPGRRAMGLILLARVKRKEGFAEARKLAEDADSALPAELRRAAIEMLLADRSKEAEAHIATHVGNADPLIRRAAFAGVLARYTETNMSPAMHVGDQAVWVQFLSSSPGVAPWTRAEPAANAAWEPPALPAALTADLVRPFFGDDDPQTRAGASYLLALMGDDIGLVNLLDTWRANREEEQGALRLARAISALGDDRNVRYLREMYESMAEQDRDRRAGALYQSIRRMKGPEAVELRTRMRKEVGSKLFQPAPDASGRYFNFR